MSTLTVRADQVRPGDTITHVGKLTGFGTVKRIRKHRAGWPYVVAHMADGGVYDLDCFEQVTVERPGVAA